MDLQGAALDGGDGAGIDTGLVAQHLETGFLKELPVLHAARRCLLLATGAEKKGAVEAMLGEPRRHAPASLLRRERLIVVLDDAADPTPHTR